MLPSELVNREDHDITRLLQDWSEGQQGALDRLSERVYPELKKLAEAHYRRERPGGTLQPTALVNEAYIKLIGREGGSWRDRLQFFKFASNIIRHVLVDYFRSSKAQKRGGGVAKVSFDEAVGKAEHRDVDLMRLEEALRSLKSVDELQSQIVELRFFGGLTVDEVAESLGLSRAKVKREWGAASAWLYREVVGDE